MLLEVNGVTKKFGGLMAVDGVSFSLGEKEILGIIGPNGAGKTTLINLINGLYMRDDGSITLKGERIDGLKPCAIASRGIGRTFQVIKLFGRMTVLENMLVPMYARKRFSSVDKALEILDFLNLTHLKDEYAKNLSGGQQQLLQFGRALMLDPEILLLDEPFAGIHPKLKKEISDLIRTMREEGKAFIVISHDLASVFKLCERLMVMNEGRVIAEGGLDEVRKSKRVIEAYLGG
jgi:branched-chain amino acid transport system ATP-binding protein